MGSSILWLAMALGPLLILVGALRAIDHWSWAAPRQGPRRRRHRSRVRRADRAPRTARVPLTTALRRVRAGTPEHRPLQVVAADLRRLTRELAVVPAGAPFVRWQALRVAYDRVLGEAAELLDVPHALAEASTGTARDIERLRVICALEAAGLRVQD